GHLKRGADGPLVLADHECVLVAVRSGEPATSGAAASRTRHGVDQGARDGGVGPVDAPRLLPGAVAFHRKDIVEHVVAHGESAGAAAGGHVGPAAATFELARRA